MDNEYQDKRRFRIFCKKCIVITACVWFLLYFFFPSYQFINEKHRFNVVNGKSERYVGYRGPLESSWSE
jgi:hypothetical protein